MSENPLYLCMVTSGPKLWEAQRAVYCSVRQEAGFSKVDGDTSFSTPLSGAMTAIVPDTVKE